MNNSNFSSVINADNSINSSTPAIEMGFKFSVLYSNLTKLAGYALPISVSAVINMLSGFISMLFVAELGKKELAAAALGVSTFMTIFTMVVTIFYALGILVSHYKGQEKNPKEIGVLIKNGFWLAILLFIPAFFILWTIDRLLLIFGLDPQLVVLTHDYFYYAGLSMLPVLINAVIFQFFSGIGRPRFMMMISLMSLPFIVLLSYLVILGKYNFPEMGLAGITYANFVVNMIVSFCIVLYASFGKKTRQYQILFGSWLPNLALCKRILTLGLPIGIQFGGELAAMAVATYLLGYFGVQALAANQIASQCSIIVVMVSLGISQGLSLLVSQALSQANFNLIRQYLVSGIILLCLFFIIVFITFLCVPERLISLYIDLEDPNNKDFIALSAQFLAISSLVLFFDGFRNLFASGLRGLQDSKAPMTIGLICLWLISLPLCYGIGFHLTDGPIGARVGFGVGFILAAGLLWKRIWYKTKQKS